MRKFVSFYKAKGKHSKVSIKQGCELVYLCDIMSHPDLLNLQLQGQGRVFIDMYTARTFITKLCLWETQMLQGNLAHFHCCQTVKTQISTAVFPSTQFAEKLSAEFPMRFAQKCRLLFSNPFAVDMESAPTELQMELIELLCTR